ncbi:MAG TPA: hypothetical protein VIF62_38770 [Labilithrix sp.]
MRRALIAVQIVSVLAVLFCAYTILGRVAHGCELEWTTGAVFDHAERVASGQPIYIAPSIDWIPLPFPPAYYAVVGPLMKVFPGFMAGRIVSILATLVQAVCVWRLASKHGARRTWCIVAIGFFAGAFAYCGLWYDVERPDSLFVATIAVGITILAERTGVFATAVAGAIVGAAFFVDQPALWFTFGGIAALGISRQWNRAAVFAIAAGAVLFIGLVGLQAKTGWFAYYVLRMPRLEASLAKHAFLDDAPTAFALVSGSAFFVARWLRQRAKPGTGDAVLACAVCAGALAAIVSRAQRGGQDNVLMPFTMFACPAAAVAGARLAALRARTWMGPLVPLAAAAQMVIWTYDPPGAIPQRSAVRFAQQFERKVKQLEQDGEVLVTGRGHVTSRRHAHMVAILDVLRAEGKVPDELARPFRDRRFAAIVIDSFDDLELSYMPELHGKLLTIVLASYYVAERLDAEQPDARVGYRTHPRWVLRPRRDPIEESDAERVRCRAKTERAIAETAERAAREGVRPEPRPDVEKISAEACRRAFSITPFPPNAWVEEL